MRADAKRSSSHPNHHFLLNGSIFFHANIMNHISISSFLNPIARYNLIWSSAADIMNASRTHKIYIYLFIYIF